MAELRGMPAPARFAKAGRKRPERQFGTGCEPVRTAGGTGLGEAEECGALDDFAHAASAAHPRPAAAHQPAEGHAMPSAGRHGEVRGACEGGSGACDCLGVPEVREARAHARRGRAPAGLYGRAGRRGAAGRRRRRSIPATRRTARPPAVVWPFRRSTSPPPSSSRRPCAHRTRNVPDPHDGPRPPPPPPAAALAPPRSPGAEHAAAGRRKSPRPRGARLAKWVENARDRGRRPATAAGRIGEPLGPAFRHEAGDFLAVLGILRHMPSPGAQNRRIIPAAGVFLARGPAGAHPDPDVGKCLYCAPAPSKQCKNSTLR